MNNTLYVEILKALIPIAIITINESVTYSLKRNHNKSTTT